MKANFVEINVHLGSAVNCQHLNAKMTVPYTTCVSAGQGTSCLSSRWPQLVKIQVRTKTVRIVNIQELWHTTAATAPT